MNRFRLTLVGLLLSGLAMSLWAAGPYSSTFKKQFRKAGVRQIAVTAGGVMTRAAGDVPAVTVLQEDFSNLTAGTEEAPDATDIGSSGATGYDIAEGYMKEGRWTGAGVHQAGGACALMKYYNKYYDEDELGYLSTPEMELYGECVITFRARRASTNPDKGSLWLALCDNSEGPLDDKTYSLTGEWQQYEFRSSKATFSDMCIFQFTAEDGEVLLDDIEVTRKRNRIPAPTANAPVNVSPTEFIASWNPTPTAESYLLNVYYKAMPEGEKVEGTLTESFDGISLKADGSIDTSAPNYPEGWVIDLSKHGKTDTGTSDGWYASGPLSLCLDAEGDSIVSPRVPASLSHVSFWIRPSKIDYYEDVMSLVGVHVMHRDGTWEHISNLPCYWLEEEGGLYEYDTDVLGDDAVMMKLTVEQMGDIVFYVDDFTLDYVTQPVPFPVITDEELTDTFRVVSGINPETEYYYYVQAKEGDIVSERTYPMWVDGIVGVKPVVLEPADVTPTGFTARWSPLHNAQNYDVNLYESITVAEAGQEITLLTESFDKAAGGSVDNPQAPTGWGYMFNLTELGLTSTNWKGMYPVWTDGMVGGRAGSDWSRGGMMTTPPLPLGDGGDVTVSFKAYNCVPGDKLAVIVMDNPNATQGILGYEIPFSETDKAMLEEKVRITADIIKENVPAGNDYYISFLTTKAGAFFLDEVTVKQVRLTAGETVYAPRDFVSSAEDSYVFEGLAEGAVYAYDVTAWCYKDFVTYTSEKSDVMTVSLTAGGIDAPAVRTASDGKTEYYNLAGQKLDGGSLPAGAVVVVKDAKGTRKVMKR